MKNNIFTVIALMAISSVADANEFGNPELGEMKAPSCVFCHNPNGAPSQPNYPNLNGQNSLYLFNAMKAYQNDERQGAMAELMKAQLQNLTEEDLKDIAAFYSTID
ncbi:cytochrome c-554(548) [Vibrio mediterranei AK1]|uniref:c-type cytochrome n=1 Tax=Vibrio mediterranei TaxID=689 RepID=UPI0001540100|nr:cytochrome c [Vibrio mediterranei]EDL55591.1 cytochrome c-554(548) [Vibrio mediterranei AK1]